MKKKKKAKLEKKKKVYETFPPPQPLRKEDILMESGEYFLTEAQRKSKQA